jgi:hypothetical protein
VQKTKEMDAKGRRIGVWIRMLGYIPYLSSPARGSLLGAALRAHIACSSYPDADKGAQVPLISRRWMAKWWCSGTKMTFRPIGSGIVVIIASGPVTFATQ